jgi:biotin carboxyl carrier protein
MAPGRSIFRQEALDAVRGGPEEGAVLHLLPRWSRWAYWFMVAVVVAGLGYAGAASVGDYAEGPAVVRVDGRTDLTTAAGGVVTQVQVRPGEKVKAGQVLVRFYAGSERQELERINREWELKLVRILLYPAEQATRDSLAALRAERELAEARIDARAVMAPRTGIVANLRARPGQSFAAGDVVLTLVAEGTGAHSVVALVPGQFRPMLRPGMPLRLELEGFSHAYTSMPITWVGNEAVGPSEIRRYLGPEVADTIAVHGSVVVVHARLPGKTFNFESKTYRYYDGIPGRVSIRVRTLRLLTMLVPSLRGLFEAGA